MKARPSPTQRGYGAAHNTLRRRWAKLVDAGLVRCSRCGRPIVAGTPWDLGHHDFDRSRYTGPEHQRCNRSAAGRRKQRRTSRAW